MISFADALSLVLNNTWPGKAIELNLAQAGNCRLAEPIAAGEDLPSYNRSPLDGYALIAADLKDADECAPVSLRVKSPESVEGQLRQGEAVKVMTGMPIPPGSDCVIRQEHTYSSNGQVRVMRRLNSGENVILVGEDVEKGTPLFKKGDLLTPPRIGLLAALGHTKVMVMVPPKVAVLSTGNDLVSIDQLVTKGFTRDANSYMLRTLIEEYSGLPVMAGIVGDDFTMLTESLEKSLEVADLILTSGGISVGENDLLPKALEKIGAQVLFKKVAMKPGTPMIAAKMRNKLILALSGNPGACLVSFEQFAGPAILKMQGYDKCTLPQTFGRLGAAVKVRPGKQVKFLRSYCCIGADQRLTATPLDNQRPGSLFSFSSYNCYIMLDEATDQADRGDEVLLQFVRRSALFEPCDI